MSIPTITVTTSPNLLSSYPMFYSPSIITANALTPSSLIPYMTVPTVSSLTPMMYPSLNNSMLPSSLYPYVPLYPSIASYPDVNADRTLREKVTNYFYEKISGTWAKYNFLDLYKMLTVSNGNATLLKDEKQIEGNTKNDPKENAVKYEHMMASYLTKDDIAKLLNKFRKHHNINWWDLKHHSDKIRKYIEHKVGKYMLSLVRNKSK